MKYNDNGTYKDIYVKSFDTLPVGTEVDYDGETVPTGWTEVEGYEEVEASDYITISNSFTLLSAKAFKSGSIVFINFDVSGTINNGETVLGTCTNKLVDTFFGAGRVARWSGSSLQAISPATFVAISNGALRTYTSTNGTQVTGTLVVLVND